MIGNCRFGSVTADFGTVSPVLASPPASPAGGVPIAAALLTVRRFFEERCRARRRPPGGSGGPEAPSDEHATARSILNDPHFWMLLVH
jgi:hypothetical protein